MALPGSQLNTECFAPFPSVLALVRLRCCGKHNLTAAPQLQACLLPSLLTLTLDSPTNLLLTLPALAEPTWPQTAPGAWT